MGRDRRDRCHRERLGDFRPDVLHREPADRSKYFDLDVPPIETPSPPSSPVGRLVALLLVVVVLAAGESVGAGTVYLSPQSSVNGIRLVPASRAIHIGCAEAAAKLKTAIYCPTRVPARWVPRFCVGCNGTFSATGWFPAPKGYRGQPGESTGHFTVWAARPRFIREGYVGCSDGTISGHVLVARVRMTWVVCPKGSTLDSGHVLLRWSRDGWIYALSLHSNSSTNRHLLRLIAGHLVLIR